MTKPKALLLTGYGINCDEETQYGFQLAGAEADIVHVNDLIAGKFKFDDYQMFVLPGGFSYGDDTGSGNALANRLRNHLWDELQNFIEQDHLVLGICNGFQMMVNLGLLPALNAHYGERQVALEHNESARYINRWIDLEVTNQSPWLNDIKQLSLPIAHGEGKLYADPQVLVEIEQKKLVALRYVAGEMQQFHGLEVNPNGSIDAIAGLTDESGRLFGLMPHPDRALDFTNLPNWTNLREHFKRAGQDIPSEGPGVQIFRNAVKYFA